MLLGSVTIPLSIRGVVGVSKSLVSVSMVVWKGEGTGEGGPFGKEG